MHSQTHTNDQALDDTVDGSLVLLFFYVVWCSSPGEVARTFCACMSMLMQVSQDTAWCTCSLITLLSLGLPGILWRLLGLGLVFLVFGCFVDLYSRGWAGLQPTT